MSWLLQTFSLCDRPTAVGTVSHVAHTHQKAVNKNRYGLIGWDTGNVLSCIQASRRDSAVGDQIGACKAGSLQAGARPSGVGMEMANGCGPVSQACTGLVAGSSPGALGRGARGSWPAPRCAGMAG